VEELHPLIAQEALIGSAPSPTSFTIASFSFTEDAYRNPNTEATQIQIDAAMNAESFMG
jgi:hypothetical protein